jgi:flagellar hook-length control protein FliK
VAHANAHGRKHTEQTQANKPSNIQDAAGSKSHHGDQHDADDPNGALGTLIDPHHVTQQDGTPATQKAAHPDRITPRTTLMAHSGHAPEPTSAAAALDKGAHDPASAQKADALALSAGAARGGAASSRWQALGSLTRQEITALSSPKGDRFGHEHQARTARLLNLAGINGQAATTSNAPGVQNPATLGTNAQPGAGLFSVFSDAPTDLSKSAGKRSPDALSSSIGVQAGPNSVVAGGTAQPATGSTPTASIGVPLGNDEWSQALGQQTLKMAADGTRHAQIQLHPRELGQINISVTVDHHNQAQVHFAAAHAHVRNAIEAALPQLGQAFNAGGLALGGASVGDQNSQPAFTDSGHDGQRHAGDEPQAGPAAETMSRPVAAIGGHLGGIDTFV